MHLRAKTSLPLKKTLSGGLTCDVGSKVCFIVRMRSREPMDSSLALDPRSRRRLGPMSLCRLLSPLESRHRQPKVHAQHPYTLLTRI
jgi:hypothetical protein